ncbi:DUF2642 domain-containing protein [Oceanobacillus piezotolerans]|uniref:DUF2642 domain-containing protein n=1 Tax=Oceanobacillus piezotolerans TaxID=2448030 RepID=A0A498D5Y9_9BACI|nr:DUF2642 domain-containing protein [Oceanobacillus piezotolerans]RLL45128.1 DUF2642 domain-containing protein [Oceanobacillus piezotolerans]
MELIDPLIQQPLEVNITGNSRHHGILVDIGTDVIVLYNGDDYLYIPIKHIKKIKKDERGKTVDNDKYLALEHLSLRKILMKSRGVFAEINVNGNENETVHGYVTNILNDYCVFYSPVYKTLYIPLHQLKWFIPYKNHQSPYTLERGMFSIFPSNLTLARTLDIQLEKLKGQIIVLDLGLSTDKIGLLKGISGNLIELATARGDSLLTNIQHIKSVHFQ